MSYQPAPSTLALAAVCQAATLVQQTARGRTTDTADVDTILGAILVIDAESPEVIFGRLQNLHSGFRTLAHQLGGTPVDKDAEVTRYIAGLFALERKISNNKTVLNQLGQRIGQLQRQTGLYEITSSQMMANMASVYSDVVSPAGPKIQVAGNTVLLRQPAIQDKVRALLLGGIRATVLWRQLGGKRRHILFSRKRILQDAAATLRYLDN
ncbi:high frequency lysogenization protein HflD [Bowmanella sp. JS7-9]|uniref:High frequency lysogenization protein HflD homolog n=1 Tax=Pseudobowmanella zhangzhouensis TaxID=1537679 RepID=A0ABW1XJJ5_9ALTE|nr:high frequency lysogenization protein HflD [Bowmanella sp. JS7-9]TBX27460.1 lysogenization regulator [Bowmanella sp. JS7-9]